MRRGWCVSCARRGDVECFGIGGEAMRREGVRTVVDVKDMAVLGLAEVLARISFFRRVFRQMSRLLVEERPDALCWWIIPASTCLAAAAKRHGIPVYYYISPQVWPGTAAGLARWRG